MPPTALPPITTAKSSGGGGLRNEGVRIARRIGTLQLPKIPGQDNRIDLPENFPKFPALRLSPLQKIRRAQCPADNSQRFCLRDFFFSYRSLARRSSRTRRCVRRNV